MLICRRIFHSFSGFRLSWFKSIKILESVELFSRKFIHCKLPHATPVPEMRLSGSQSKPSLSNIQVAVTLVLIVAANINSATCNDAHFLPESHFLKQFTPSDCWGHEVDCPKAAAHVDCSEAIDTSFHPADAKRAYQVFFTQGDFGYLGEFVSSLRNYCRAETQFDSSLTCTANLQFCSGVKSSGTSNIA